MFKRDHHLRIATILQTLDADLLAKHQCWFAGGTAIVLKYGEYRESVDVDFLVSDLLGYRALRLLLTEPGGIKNICRAGMSLTVARDITADQYGIRAMLQVAGAEIKFEIVREARIELEKPNEADHICAVATLRRLDMAATKLLANSDRWSDGAVYSRDLIDLAMLDLSRRERDDAIRKAQGAYESIERDLNKSVEFLLSDPDRLDVCMTALKIDEVPKALLWSRIKALRT